MKSKFLSGRFHYLPLVALVSSLSIIYLNTLAPGLTWANNGSDGGDLITAAVSGGIAHPTGYPLFLVIARLFQSIPIGTLAYRTNLMSAVATVLAAVLVYKFVTRALTDIGIGHTEFAGLAAGLAFGLAPLIWSQAVITEVYALQAFLTVSILYLFTFPVHSLHQKKMERLRGLVMGLTMGNHATTVLMIPMLLFSVWWDDNMDDARKDMPENRVGISRSRFIASSLTRQLIWLSIGLFIYLIIPLRALTHPPVNWGNPITLNRFWWLVSGDLYRSYYLGFQPLDFSGRIHTWAALLLQQFSLLGVIFGVIGGIFFLRPSKLYFHTIWIAFAYSVFAILYSSNDSFLYLIPVYISFAVWFGLGFGYLLGRIPPAPGLIRWGFGIVVIGFFMFRVFGVVDQVDASKDLRAEMFGKQAMLALPRDALVFAKDDKSVFSLWYFHFALKTRPDLVILSDALLHFDWYQESIKYTYPNLNMPGPILWPQTISNANPGRNICYVDFTDRMEIDCGTDIEIP